MRATIGCLLLVLVTAWASPLVAYDPSAAQGRGGFTVTVEDIDVDNAWERVTADTGFTQLATASRVMVETPLASVSASVSFLGMASGQLRMETLIADSTADTTTYSYDYLEAVWADTPATMPIMVFSDASSMRGSLLDSIPAGLLEYPIAHRLVPTGKTVYVDYFAFGPADSVAMADVELRVYPRVADTRGGSTGYYVAARGRVDGSVSPAGTTLAPGLVAASGGAVQVWAKGDAADQRIWVTLRGRRE